MTERMKAATRLAWLKMFQFFVARLQEASTVRSFIYLIGGAAALTNPERLDAIVGITMLVAGVFGVVLPDIIKRTQKEAGETE